MIAKRAFCGNLPTRRQAKTTSEASEKSCPSDGVSSVGAGSCVLVAVGFTVGLGEKVVASGVGLGIGAGVPVGTAVAVRVAVDLGVCVGEGVRVGSGVGEGRGVRAGVRLGVAEELGVTLG